MIKNEEFVRDIFFALYVDNFYLWIEILKKWNQKFYV